MLALVLVGGNACKKDDDPCEDVTCQNGGTCDEGTCICAAGYEGTNCETAMRTKFIASYNCSNSCLPGSSWSCSITSSATGIDKVVLQDLGNTPGLDVTGTVDGSSITIASQTDTDDAGDSWTIEGSGSISGTTLTVFLKIYH
ncbi:MAG: calcium-binding EGF-like domain-containing protein [Bacteroidetes bacterium]|nr:calcium-binding EGF-like domain-containing protein [Bacteroidota bacterium]